MTIAGIHEKGAKALQGGGRTACTTSGVVGGIPCTSATAALIPSQPPAAICHSGPSQGRSKSSKTNRLHSCRLGNLIKRVHKRLQLQHLPSGMLLAVSCTSVIRASRIMAMTMHGVADRDLRDIQQSSQFFALHRNTRRSAFLR